MNHCPCRMVLDCAIPLALSRPPKPRRAPAFSLRPSDFCPRPSPSASARAGTTSLNTFPPSRHPSRCCCAQINTRWPAPGAPNRPTYQSVRSNTPAPVPADTTPK